MSWTESDEYDEESSYTSEEDEGKRMASVRKFYTPSPPSRPRSRPKSVEKPESQTASASLKREMKSRATSPIKPQRNSADRLRRK